MSTSEEKTVLLHKHTRREFRERMQSGELKACIIPVAAIEQPIKSAWGDGPRPIVWPLICLTGRVDPKS